jgi:hypothetical protein
MKQRGYTIPPSHHVAIARWRENSDSVTAFRDLCTEPSESGLGAQFLFDNYVSWCGETEQKPVSMTKFGLRLRELGVRFERDRHGKRYALKLAKREGSVTGCDDHPSREEGEESDAYN